MIKKVIIVFTIAWCVGATAASQYWFVRDAARARRFAADWQRVAEEQGQTIRTQDSAIRNSMEAMSQYNDMIMKMDADRDVCISMLPPEQRRSFTGR